MTDDLAERAHRTAGTFLIVVAVIFTVWAPVFGLTYTQPDMGLLVIISVVPFLWAVGLLFACLAIAFAARRWQRIAALAVLAALGVETLVLGITIAVNILTP